MSTSSLFQRRLDWRFKPSRRLRFATLALYALACGSLFANGLPLVVNSCLAAVFLAYFLFGSRLFRRAPLACLSFSSGKWWLDVGEGAFTAELRDVERLSFNLLLLSFKVYGVWRKRWLLISSDSLSREDWRRLRVCAALFRRRR